MKYEQFYGLRPADRIIQPIFQTGLSKHHSIFLGTDHSGQEWIAENYKFGGVKLTRASDFFSEHVGFTVQRFSGTGLQRKAAIRRALGKVGAPYDLINFNCEHFAQYVQTGRSSSSQVEWVKNLFAFVLFVLCLGGLIYTIANSKIQNKMKHYLSFFPIGNADTTLIKLANGMDILFDYANMRCEDDKDDRRIDLPEALNKMIDGDYEVACFTHLDKDHIYGMSEYFYLQHASRYQGAGRKKIKELWVPANVLVETGLDEEDAKILRAEARYRLKQKKGIRIFSRPKKLKDWCDKQEDICFDDIKHLIVDAGTLVPGFSLAKEGIEFFVHSPFFSESTNIDRNNEAIVVQAVFNDSYSTKMLLGSDLNYAAWDDIVTVTRHFKRDYRLQWDIFHLSHHCSYLALSSERGRTVTAPTKNIKWLFETQSKDRSWIVSPSWSIPVEDTVQPPHMQAAAYYRSVATLKNGLFRVTMDHPTQSDPKPMTFEIDTVSGLKLVTKIASTAPFVYTEKPSRAG